MSRDILGSDDDVRVEQPKGRGGVQRQSAAEYGDHSQSSYGVVDARTNVVEGGLYAGMLLGRVVRRLISRSSLRESLEEGERHNSRDIGDIRRPILF